MMGMKEKAYVMSWFALYMIQCVVITVEITVISKIYIFIHSNVVLIFLFYFMYGISLFGLLLIFLAWFDKVKTGSPGALIIMIGLYYIKLAVTDHSSILTKILTSLSP